MRTLAFLSGAALIAVAACTQDFDQFAVPAGGQGGSATQSTAQTGGAGGTSTTSQGGGATSQGGGATTSQGGAGGTTSSSTTSGGAGVTCDGSPCDTDNGAACCVPNNGDDPYCDAGGDCGGGVADIFCDGPDDCPGQICCGNYSFMNDAYSSVQCRNSCDNGNQFIFCDPNGADVCEGGDNCESSDALPSGFFVCK